MHNLASLSLILILLIAACGPSKKLLDSQAKVDKLQKDSANTHIKLNVCNERLENLNQANGNLQNEFNWIQDDLNTLSAESKLTIADLSKRLKTLQDISKLQRSVMTDLKNSIANALMNYQTDELQVYSKDGNIYVSLEEKLLFASGSDLVNVKGKEALKNLAMVLNTNKDIFVMIEGHTDNVPIKTKLFKDNWDLSTARATSIVRILTIDNGFDANRITASGKGEFHPVKTNDTDEGRAGNRRTEIIISPNLSELFNLLYQ